MTGFHKHLVFIIFACKFRGSCHQSTLLGLISLTLRYIELKNRTRVLPPMSLC